MKKLSTFFSLQRNCGDGIVVLAKDKKFFTPNLFGELLIPYEKFCLDYGVRDKKTGKTRYSCEKPDSFELSLPEPDGNDFYTIFPPDFFKMSKESGYTVTRRNIDGDELGRLLDNKAPLMEKKRVFADTEGNGVVITVGDEIERKRTDDEFVDDDKYVPSLDGFLPLYTGLSCKRPIRKLFSIEYCTGGRTLREFKVDKNKKFFTNNIFFHPIYCYSVDDVVKFVNDNGLMPVPFSEMAAHIYKNLQLVADAHTVFKSKKCFDAVRDTLLKRVKIGWEISDHSAVSYALDELSKVEKLYDRWKKRIFIRVVELGECVFSRYIEDEIRDSNVDELLWDIFSSLSTTFTEEADKASAIVHNDGLFRFSEKNFETDEFPVVGETTLR